MKAKWLIEKYCDDPFFDSLISELKKQKIEYKIIKCFSSFPFSCGQFDEFHDNDCVIFYGSLIFARQLQKDRPWIPGPYCNFDNFKCTKYYSHFGKYLLNQDYIMLPLMEIHRRKEEIYKNFGVDDCIFLRPDSGAKTFTGGIISKDSFCNELNHLCCYAGLPTDEILTIVSSPKKIDAEWRVVCCDRFIVGTSLYKQNGEIVDDFMVEGMPVDAFLLAQEVASNDWQPDTVYTLDICKSNGKYSLLEINSFSCSGLYGCDPHTIVREVSKAAEKEWKEYNIV